MAANPVDPAARGIEIEPSIEQIRAYLAKILASEMFVRSDRLCRFLHLTVERTLAGDTAQISEYIVGRDVFDRDHRYDPQIDSIVRVEARRLRNKLREYYQGPGADDPVVIAFPKGSYVPVFSTSAPAAAVRTTGRDLDPRTIAVLPFVNLSSEPDQDFFCDGITEEILNALTAVPELNIVARTSVFYFKGTNADVREIGERLGAGTVIEGSVRKAGRQLRICAKAIKASDGLTLWSDTFDRDLADVFAIQDEIARAVAGSLRVSLAPSPESSARARDFEGYMLYLRGRHYWNQMSLEGIENALDQFTRAIALFPNYTPPYAALADAYGHLASWGAIPPADALEKGKRAALEAVRLDQRSADALATLGSFISLFEWRWEEGVDLMTRALELEPSNVRAHELYGLQWLYRGNFPSALRCLDRALQLDPLSPRGLRFKASHYFYQRQYDKAVDVLKTALPLGRDATNREVLCSLGWVYTLQGRYEEAIEIFRNLPDGPFLVTKLGALGEAYARSGDTTAARDVLKRLQTLSETGYVSPRGLIYICAGLGDWDRAFRELDQACDDHCPWLPSVHVDPRFDSVRSDPRFKRLIERMHLAESSKPKSSENCAGT
jgi:TolB-like protein/Flp pilus assembly protein TadD